MTREIKTNLQLKLSLSIVVLCLTCLPFIIEFFPCEIDDLSLPNQDIILCSGQSYRNLLILKNANCDASELKAFEPHMNLGQPIETLILHGTSDKSVILAEKCNQIMENSVEQLKYINNYQNSEADMIYLWSPSAEPRLPSFHRKFGLDGAIITGLDFLRGIGIAARMEARIIPGATGYSNTNLNEKLVTDEKLEIEESILKREIEILILRSLLQCKIDGENLIFT